MSIETGTPIGADDALKTEMSKKLQESEIQFKPERALELSPEEVSDLEAAIDVGYHATDLLRSALQGKTDTKEAAKFGDAQVLNLSNLLDTIKNSTVREQVVGQIREINSLQAQLSEQTAQIDLSKVQDQIQQM